MRWILISECRALCYGLLTAFVSFAYNIGTCDKGYIYLMYITMYTLHVSLLQYTAGAVKGRSKMLLLIGTGIYLKKYNFIVSDYP